MLDDLANYLERHSRLEDSADDATTMTSFKGIVLQHLRVVRRRKVSLGCLKTQMIELGYLEHEAHRSTGEHVRGWKKDDSGLSLTIFNCYLLNRTNAAREVSSVHRKDC